MDYRQGRTGVMVSPLCMGAMNFGGPTEEAESIAMINRALDAGINFIDTANVYNGEERIVGRALKENGCRDQIVLATKVHGGMGRPERAGRLALPHHSGVTICSAACRPTASTSTSCTARR